MMNCVCVFKLLFTSVHWEQTGAWGCFDEFNRINIEVLSVVAQQILSILSALSAAQTKFHFDGQHINLVWSCGIFITMNPGLPNLNSKYAVDILIIFLLRVLFTQICF